MWLYRDLNVLEHQFWWADPRATGFILASHPRAAVLSNPVRANVSELQAFLNTSVYGSAPANVGLLPETIAGPESACGWGAIRNSYSGRLQAALLAYSVPSLIRLALLHWRIRPSDLDPVQNMKISFDEMVDFAYLNLESLLNLVLSALFITIFAERVLAGEECEVDHVRGEKNATAIACIFLFLNLLVSGKPYKGVGYLVLTIYRFLVKDVFNFVIMYSIFFVAFLLALQTMHNADHVYLNWMEYTTTIFPQIQAVTRGKAYLNNANIPASANQLLQTDMAVDGCQSHMLAIYSTAFSLLEISFGDGLADGLSAARGTDYECAGFRESGLVAMILVFWVFLTNVLILNMLIAMMDTTMDRQVGVVRALGRPPCAACARPPRALLVRSYHGQASKEPAVGT